MHTGTVKWFDDSKGFGFIAAIYFLKIFYFYNGAAFH